MMNQDRPPGHGRRKRFRPRNRNRNRNRNQGPRPHLGHHLLPQPAVSSEPEPVSLEAIQTGDNVFSRLLPEIQQALAQSGYVRPTPVQEECIPHLLAGRDLLGSAQTGTGKTAAFTLPLLQYLTEHPLPPTPRRPRVLVLAPTRELAAQIGESTAIYGRFLNVFQTVVYGGVGQRPQEQALEGGVDILIATPGRLLDLMNQGFAELDGIEAFVLDEADRMLDMGFLPDVRRIIDALPADRQSLFFSATLPPEVVELANTLLTDPVRVTIAPEKPTVERIEQKVMFVDKRLKDALLVSLFEQPAMDKAIVFVQRKRVAGQVTHKLQSAGISTAVIHGDKTQAQRIQALEAFRHGRVRALVATDVAARGLDVDGITHVINYELPLEAETYVHRIGRTARAGAGGDAVSLCMASERSQLRAIERLIRKEIFVDREHPYHSDAAEQATGAEAKPPPRPPAGGGSGKSSRRKKWKNRKKPSSPQLQHVSPVLRRLAASSATGNASGNREGANRSRPFAGPRRPRQKPRRSFGW